jgi:hypothetical protein
MKGYEKFEDRLREVGLWDEWCKQGQCGRVGAETSTGISIFVHEDEKDAYTEFKYPPMEILEESEEFREKALKEFRSCDDYEFIGKLYVWAKDYRSNYSPLLPVDIYFIATPFDSVNFKDDDERSRASKQRKISRALNGMLSHRLTREQLDKMLSSIFGKTINVEKGLYDEDWVGDDYFTFCVDDDDIGGYFDLYYIPMPRKPDHFFITEVCICFDHRG